MARDVTRIFTETALLLRENQRLLKQVILGLPRIDAGARMRAALGEPPEGGGGGGAGGSEFSSAVSRELRAFREAAEALEGLFKALPTPRRAAAAADAIAAFSDALAEMSSPSRLAALKEYASLAKTAQAAELAKLRRKELDVRGPLLREQAFEKMARRTQRYGFALDRLEGVVEGLRRANAGGAYIRTPAAESGPSRASEHPSPPSLPPQLQLLSELVTLRENAPLVREYLGAEFASLGVPAGSGTREQRARFEALADELSRALGELGEKAGGVASLLEQPFVAQEERQRILQLAEEALKAKAQGAIPPTLQQQLIRAVTEAIVRGAAKAFGDLSSPTLAATTLSRGEPASAPGLSPSEFDMTAVGGRGGSGMSLGGVGLALLAEAGGALPGSVGRLARRMAPFALRVRLSTGGRGGAGGTGGVGGGEGGAGGMGWLPLGLGLAAVGELVGLGVKGFGMATQEGMTLSPVWRMLGGRTDLGLFMHNVNTAGARYGFLPMESAQAMAQLASMTGRAAPIMNALTSLMGLSRGMGIDLSQVVGGYGSLVQAGAFQTQRATPKEFARLIGEAVAQAQMQGRQGEVLQALLQATNQVSTVLAGVPWKSILGVQAALNASGIQPLMGLSGANVLQQISQGMASPGLGPAGQLLNLRLLQRPGMNFFQLLFSANAGAYFTPPGSKLSNAALLLGRFASLLGVTPGQFNPKASFYPKTKQAGLAEVLFSGIYGIPYSYAGALLYAVSKNPQLFTQATQQLSSLYGGMGNVPLSALSVVSPLVGAKQALLAHRPGQALQLLQAAAYSVMGVGGSLNVKGVGSLQQIAAAKHLSPSQIASAISAINQYVKQNPVQFMTSSEQLMQYQAEALSTLVNLGKTELTVLEAIAQVLGARWQKTSLPPSPIQAPTPHGKTVIPTWTAPVSTSAVAKRIAEVARKDGIPPNIALAVAMQESSLGRASSNVMQVQGMDKAPWYKSVDVGVKMLAQYWRETHHNLAETLAAYNMGASILQYFKEHGGYSIANMIAFSNAHRPHIPFTSIPIPGTVYGDPYYVQHVERYLHMKLQGTSTTPIHLHIHDSRGAVRTHKVTHHKLPNAKPEVRYAGVRAGR